nr:unnamed protein product [Digitaria exilis]
MAGTTKQRGGVEEMSWISRKLFLYNVTIGLYVLDCTAKSMWQAFDNHLKISMELGTRNYTMVVLCE